MVRNKSIGDCPNITGKTKKAGSLIQTSKGSTLAEEPAVSKTPAVIPELETKYQEGYPDRVYLLASVIFQNNHLEKIPGHCLVDYGKLRGLPLPEVKDRVLQCMAYELTFDTFKYQDLLEEIMIDTSLYINKKMRNDQMSLVAVMLYDFQHRRFLPRVSHGQEIIQEVRDVENFLLRFKTKLAASVARTRVNHHLTCIEFILPESVRKKQWRSISLPLYVWVNTLKSSLDEVRSVLKSAGFFQVKSIEQLAGRTFCRDLHCGDTLVFPAQLKAELYSTQLLNEHKLIIQDKSCMLGPNASCSLLPEDGDVLMVGSFSGLTVSHTAALIAEKHEGNNTVYACVSGCTDAQRKELQLTVSTMGCKNVKLIPEVFQSLDSGDKRLLKVRVILCNPKCSMSALSNPVEFILRENADTDLLQGLSQDSVAQSKLEALAAQQREDIDHALKFSKVQAVVYSTCSSYPEENVDVVSKALEQNKACSGQEGEPKQTNFRLISFPLTSTDPVESTEEAGLCFNLEPSDYNNGCFLAILEREPEVKEHPEDIIARANAIGLLDRISGSRRTKKDRGQTNRMKKGAKVCSSQPNLPSSLHSKRQQPKSRSSGVLCGHQRATNKPRSQAGSPKPLPLQQSKGSTLTKSSTPLLNPTTATPPSNTTLDPSAPSPTTLLVRSRRAQQEVLKPVVLALPALDFPDFFPHKHRLDFTSGYTNWTTPDKFESPHGVYKESVNKSRTTS